MKRNTLEKLYACLRDGRPELQLDEALRIAAERPLRRMLEMTAVHTAPPTGD
jgi:quinolinate synthase